MFYKLTTMQPASLSLPTSDGIKYWMKWDRQVYQYNQSTELVVSYYTVCKCIIPDS